MHSDTLTPLHNEAAASASPQLAASAAFVAHSADVTLELADLTVGQLSAVAALMLSLDAAEAPARSAEIKLADNSRHCICHAAEVPGAEARDRVSPFAALACAVTSLGVAA